MRVTLGGQPAIPRPVIRAHRDPRFDGIGDERFEWRGAGRAHWPQAEAAFVGARRRIRPRRRSRFCGPAGVRFCRDPERRGSAHPPPRSRANAPGPVAPAPGAACAAGSRRCGSCPSPTPAATPGRWPRPFASPPARWRETTAATEDGCPRRSCPQAPKGGRRRPGKSTAHARCATLGFPRLRDRENHRATAAPRDIVHRLPRSKSAAPSPAACADNLRP